jgi:hypothetical protein
MMIVYSLSALSLFYQSCERGWSDVCFIIVFLKHNVCFIIVLVFTWAGRMYALLFFL